MSPLTAIGVEASKESGLPGEYVIDLSEYENRPDGSETVTYSQLKHSTQRVDQHFVFSELKGTLEGFAERFRATLQSTASGASKQEYFFAFVSNRRVAENIKEAVKELAAGAGADSGLRRDLSAATGFTGSELRDFFGRLTFRDGEQDYAAQKRLLRGELTECVVGFVDSDDADRLVHLVADKVMPKDERGSADGLISREDVLLRLNATAQELFPALPAFDPPGQLLRREQHDELVAHVLDDSAPAIIHAEGGVGKTVVREFSLAESALHLRTRFPEALDNDVAEFHRLSMGNPRVQAQEMGMPGATLTTVLSNLGPRVTTVDAQIAARLDRAAAALKAAHGTAFAAQMDAICYGLANLPLRDQRPGARLLRQLK